MQQATPLVVAPLDESGPNPFASIARVAVKDQIYEPLLTACLVISIVAVLVPLLLLYSIKVGFVERIRADLIRDPSFREIQPAAADIKPAVTLEGYARLPGVEFFVPSVMLAPREIPLIARVGGSKKTLQPVLLPTANGDPMLERIEGHWDEAAPDAIVVSRDVAESASLKIGDAADLMVLRTENRKTQRVAVRATVTGILPKGATSLPTILASRTLDAAVEDYRAGIAVPERGWLPAVAAPKQAFEQVLVGAPRALDETEQRDIMLSVGGLAFELVASSETSLIPLFELFGLPAASQSEAAFEIRPGLTHFYLLRNSKSGSEAKRFYSAEDVQEALDIAVSFAGNAFGINRPWPISAGGKGFRLALPDPRLFVGLRAVSYPWRFGKVDLEPNLRIYVSPDDHKAFEEAATVFKNPGLVPDGAVALHTEAEPQPFVESGYVYASPSLIAMLSRGLIVRIAYDAANKTIVEKTTGLRGFRLVARNLDDVPRLVAHFDSIGVVVRAKSDAIVKLQRLDRSLGLIVFAVGAVTFLGGLAVMSATCISNVKRKSVQYATFRLIGLSKEQVFQVPVIQSVSVAAAAVVIGILVFKAMSAIINNHVARQVNFDGALSVLEWRHLAVAALVVVFGSACASLLAAREATRIDPSLALRGEG
jgi:putative ABC transport system permease protein